MKTPFSKFIFFYCNGTPKGTWVGFMPNLKLTHQNWVEKKGTRRLPARVIGLGGSEHQRVVSVWVGFEMVKKRWKKHRSSKNLTRVDEISPDSVQISPDLREIVPESRNLSVNSGFLGFKGEKLKPDRLESVSGDEDPSE